MTKLEEGHFSGISFDWVVVRELRFVDNPDSSETGPLGDLTVSLSIQKKVAADGSWCRTILRVKLDPPDDAPEAFRVLLASVEGNFTAQGNAVVDMETFSRRQAPVILMPFVREALASATSKSRFGQLLLPPINVTALTEDLEKQGVTEEA